jgi:hypothetical protein
MTEDKKPARPRSIADDIIDAVETATSNGRDRKNQRNGIPAIFAIEPRA